VRLIGEDAREDKPETAADAGEQTRIPPDREYAQQQESRDGAEDFGLRKRYEAGNQDPRGDGSQGPHERVFHRKPIVAPGKSRGSHSWLQPAESLAPQNCV